jgi:hypothetical protein
MSSASTSRTIRRRAKRNEVVSNCAITAACDHFFGSRGLDKEKQSFNPSLASMRVSQDPQDDHGDRDEQ